VTSVGATQIRWDLDQSCAHSEILQDLDSAETAVNYFTGGFDGGGGFSTVFSAPTYQLEFTQLYSESAASPPTGTYNSSNRGYPDISALGHNYLVIIDGQPATIGGTSASAPALAGLISLLNDKLVLNGREQLGFLNPLLYQMAKEKPDAFRKIRPRTYDLSGTIFENSMGGEYTVGGKLSISSSKSELNPLLGNFCSRFACCKYGYMGTSTDGTWDGVTGLGVIDFTAFVEYLGIEDSSSSSTAR
jgi:subtilase family serine protease